LLELVAAQQIGEAVTEPSRWTWIEGQPCSTHGEITLAWRTPDGERRAPRPFPPAIEELAREYFRDPVAPSAANASLAVRHARVNRAVNS